MNYTLHQLQVFVKVVQTQSVTKAAEELFLTQPGVSIQMRNFQEQFDIPLTEVIGRQLYVTEFGKEIATLAVEILDKVHAIDYRTAAFKGILSGRLKISSASTGKYVMPYFLSDFLKVHPGVDLTIDVNNKSKVIQSLEDNEVDFGLVSVLPDKLKVDEELLVVNKLYLVGNKDHVPKTKKETKDIFNQLPMIYREEGSATRLIMEGFFERTKIIVKKKMQLTSNEAVKQAVIAGLGYSIMPLIGIRNEIQNGELQIVPVSGFPIRSEWRLIWLKNKKLSPLALHYLDYVRTNKSDIIQKSFSWIENF
ncbi:LysR family transcriptional regulator [Mucilaginibacter sp. KACC 22063]|uniref:LysR family transcriptional regulator n=1 Tax=Mucilaginibacter sp. KACC 22063 TaxID=3025666 RepID=UPI0023660C6A|nr:LysR family transcriptional regulator [Mucilaginibacter sp. KACC 22063]WDF56167.1 LysR family transcriptional regulator [Mucilaginibacter sp. KACC 22063]